MKQIKPRDFNLMTVKEVANILQRDQRTIQLKAKDLFPDVVKNGKTTYLNEEQVTLIKLNLEKKFEVKTDLEKQLIIAEAMQILNENITNLKAENETLKIDLDKSKQYHSIKKVKMMGYLKDVSARKAWSPLKRYSIENDYKIISIFDANYGEVKTYHSDVWKAVYGITL